MFDSILQPFLGTPVVIRLEKAPILRKGLYRCKLEAGKTPDQVKLTDVMAISFTFEAVSFKEPTRKSFSTGKEVLALGSGRNSISLPTSCITEVGPFRGWDPRIEPEFLD